jgi:xanthine dehydrogenase YagR molybdenum-binding subunit
MTQAVYPNRARVDAREKVCGSLKYAADDVRPELAHAMLAVATIARGRVVAIDTTAARSVEGVLLVLTHDDFAGLKSAGYLFHEGYGFQSFQPLLGPEIAYRGQPIALVVAETLEAAIEAAALVRAAYESEPFTVTLDGAGADAVDQAAAIPIPMFANRVAGDADAAFAAADVQIDGLYEGPPQHQNPMELLATVAEWRDGTLTIHEPTQNSGAIQHGLARALGIEPAQVHVVAWSAGGGFGQKNSLQMHTLPVAVAARRLQRPVKIVVPRWQVCHDASFRPPTRHRVRLGADRTGSMAAAIHEVTQQTSRHDLFPSLATDMTARLYGIPNFRGREQLVRTDVQTPGFMRTPWEQMAGFAFESAVDELAYAVGQDPVALRIANDTANDPISGKPFSSRHVVECLQRGAERFDWARRTPAPGSMRANDGTLIGLGVAAGAYPASMVPAVARLRVTDDGAVSIALGVHEMGQGIRNTIAAVLASRLGVPAESVTAWIGDTNAGPQHNTAGAWGTATAVPAALQAADEMLAALHHLDSAGGQTDDESSRSKEDRSRRPPHEILRDVGRPFLEVEVRHLPVGLPDAAFGRLTNGLLAIAGPEYPEFVAFSYIAHFVEVHIEPTTRRICVPRVVSVADCGRVVSPRTARSQVSGAVVWGIGCALREASEVDSRFGGFLNADLAEYLVPVNADIGNIDVDFIDEPDQLLNDAGVKGLGEVALVGVAPAIANAVYHATGRRIRRLPIRIEDLL